HDLSDGGLAIALAESVLAQGVGATVTLPDDDAFVALFSESSARALVTVAPESFEAFAELCAANDVPCQCLGLTGGEALVVENVLEIPVTELRETHTSALPAIFG
ncbi:AIR synthase-related protein, partial [Streptosporangium algeriense]